MIGISPSPLPHPHLTPTPIVDGYSKSHCIPLYPITMPTNILNPNDSPVDGFESSTIPACFWKVIL